jgi:hypothetical protein
MDLSFTLIRAIHEYYIFLSFFCWASQGKLMKLFLDYQQFIYRHEHLFLQYALIKVLQYA